MAAVQLLCAVAAGALGHSQQAVVDDFESLKRKLPFISMDEGTAAIRRAATSVPPPRTQDKIKHFVVLLLENRAFDHIFGCMLDDKPGIDGLSDAHTVNNVCVDKVNCPKQKELNVSCGTAQYVCETHTYGGGEFDLFAGHFSTLPGDNTSNTSTYPYSQQSDSFSGRHLLGNKSFPLAMFNGSQLPVKRAIADEFGVFNKYFTSVPSASYPNHMMAQSATSCGIHDNIHYNECGGNTTQFPQMTIWDSLFLNNVSFGLYINSTCGRDGIPCGTHPIFIWASECWDRP